MDIKRNLLLLALAVVSYLMLLAWNKDYPADNAENAQVADSVPEFNTSNNVVAANDLPVGQVNETTSNTDVPQLPVAGQPEPAPPVVSASAQLITVKTPKQIVTINPVGGDIVGVALPDFPVSIETPDEPFKLLRQDGSLEYIAQSGLIGRNGPDASQQGRPRYQIAETEVTVNGESQTVDLVLPATDGVSITKRFIFSANDYLIRVQYLINNQGTTPWQGNMFGQIKRDSSPEPSDTGKMNARTFLGAAVNTDDDPYVKYDLEEIAEGVSTIEKTGGWIAFSQHYFLGSWIPDPETSNTYTIRQNNQGDNLLTFVNPAITVAPGQNATIEAGFWAGPKDQYRLNEISPELDLTIDYGMFFFIASPIFWLLTTINDAVGNFGFSILLLTLIIKTILLPLSAKSLKSMAKMRQLTPKVNALKDKYGDDKQKLMQAQMELWRKEQVNPFGGCLPMLLQMPVFLGIYWVLNESIELRQASFILWYDDLSKMDPYFVLPILFGAAMFVNQLLTPMQTTDPAQAKMMKWMPVIFSVFFLWFPAGLVLYYTANSVLSILQQWVITKQVEKTYKPKGT